MIFKSDTKRKAFTLLSMLAVPVTDALYQAGEVSFPFEFAGGFENQEWMLNFLEGFCVSTEMIM